MKVLKAIGGFFARIGRWIRDTAWVQPLLIVGGIFAIIFSIPYIVDAVEANFESGDEASQYYSKYQLSLEKTSEKSSEADELFNYIRARGKDNTVKNDKFGDQFFLTFTSDNCVGCKTVYPGFQTMESKMSDGSFASKTSTKDFKFFTIDINQSTDDEVEGSETAFSKYLYAENIAFFEEAADVVIERPYYTNQGGSESDNYGKLLSNLSDLSNFPTPTTFMFDFTFAEANHGIADILFNFDGKNGDSSSYGLARTLMDCWNHEGDFAKINA